MKLGTKLLMSSVGIVLLVLVVVLFMAITTSQESLKVSIGNDLQHMAEAAAREIDIIMEGDVVETRVLSQADVFETTEPGPMNEYLKEVVQAHPTYNDIRVVTRDAIVFASSIPGEMGKSFFVELREKGKGLFEEALRAKQGDVFFQDAHMHDGALEAMFYTPITDENNINVLYVLATSISFGYVDEMVAYLDDRTIGDKSTYLVNDPGEVIFTLDERAQIFKPLEDIAANPNLKKSIGR